MDEQKYDKLQELCNVLKTKELNRFLKKFKLNDNVIKVLKKRRRKYKNKLYSKASRERKKLAKNQKRIEIKKEIQDKEIQDKEKYKLYNFSSIYCNLD